MSRHLGELSLSSCFEMIPFTPPPIKKMSLPKADKHSLVISPQWITFQKMKCQPLALILILFSISRKAVKGRAAWSQVAERLTDAGVCSARSSHHSGCLFSYLCPQVFNLDKDKTKSRWAIGTKGWTSHWWEWYPGGHGFRDVPQLCTGRSQRGHEMGKTQQDEQNTRTVKLVCAY